MAKMLVLLNIGVASDRLLIATALTDKGVAHAVLIFRDQSRDLVLDNLTNRVKAWNENGYTYLKIQNPGKKWQWRTLFANGN